MYQDIYNCIGQNTNTKKCIIHSRMFSWVPCFVCRPILFLFSYLVISSIKVAYYITIRVAYYIIDRTPPCLMVSLICFLPLTPFRCSACSILSHHALS